MPTWIKFCGTTCLEDALASIEAGADALGFIFAPSKRQIMPAKAAAILSKIPRNIERIGVFGGKTVEQIHHLVMELDLTGIQLHGCDPPLELWSYLPKARRDSLRVIQALIVQDAFEITLKIHLEKSSDVVNTWLLDSGAGTGKTFDWKIARSQFEHWEGERLWEDVSKKLGHHKVPFIIAGGLNPENVGEAIGIFSPWGVDVVSGIESEPGRKDPQKMRAFVAAVRRAEQR